MNLNIFDIVKFVPVQDERHLTEHNYPGIVIEDYGETMAGVHVEWYPNGWLGNSVRSWTSRKDLQVTIEYGKPEFYPSHPVKRILEQYTMSQFSMIYQPIHQFDTTMYIVGTEENVSKQYSFDELIQIVMKSGNHQDMIITHINILRKYLELHHQFVPEFVIEGDEALKIWKYQSDADNWTYMIAINNIIISGIVYNSKTRTAIDHSMWNKYSMKSWLTETSKYYPLTKVL